MLHQVEVRSRQGQLLTLPLEDVSDGIILAGIEGLDPVAATLVSSGFALIDGAKYHSSRREPRNLKLKFELDPDYENYTVRDLRDRLYPYFMPKSEVDLKFRLIKTNPTSFLEDELVVDIVGRVETMDSPIFAKDPAVDISLMCFDPDFVGEEVTITGLSTAGLDEIIHEYVGTVETGIVFRLLPDRDVDEFTIYHRPPDGTLHTLDFSAPLLAGDILEISTIVGSKYARRTRNGVETPLLYAVSPQSKWLEFDRGDNSIRVYATGAGVPFEIEYTTKYGGL